MIGALAGDLIGSVYERHPIKMTAFPLFQHPGGGLRHSHPAQR